VSLIFSSSAPLFSLYAGTYGISLVLLRFITFDDLYVIIGNSTENEALEKMWLESLDACKHHLDRITFDDFKLLMKGQSQEVVANPPSPVTHLAEVPEDEEVDEGLEGTSSVLDEEIENPRAYAKKKRSASYEQKKSAWESGEFNKDPSMAMFLTSHAVGEYSDNTNDTTMSPLVVNRALYRKHRELRLAVLEASKQFDTKRTDFQTKTDPTRSKRASLIMKRGGMPPEELEDVHSRAMFEQAAIRCGRTHKNNKTVSDVTDMIVRASV
jgi:hypothetical protein